VHGTRELIHGHRNAVRRVLRRRTHGGSRRAATSLAGPVLTVSDPGHRRRIPGRRVENSAFTRPVGARTIDRPRAAFDRANIEFNWRRARRGRRARPSRNLRARPKSMQLILITARIRRQVDSSRLHGRRRDNRPLIVLSALASWRHVIATAATSFSTDRPF